MEPDTHIYDRILEFKKQGVPAALALLVQATGSSPQKEGAKMLVTADGSIVGTVGGGNLEAEVIQAALAALKSGRPRTVPFELTEEHGYACGGKVLVYIEPILPAPHLVILGAGHVGAALTRVAKFAGFSVTVVDDRAEFADPERLPDADTVRVTDFGRVFTEVAADRNTYIVIATRGHRHDFVALEAALRTTALYIGLLGSRKKAENRNIL